MLNCAYLNWKNIKDQHCKYLTLMTHNPKRQKYLALQTILQLIRCALVAVNIPIPTEG
jgi:hypothetical protein